MPISSLSYGVLDKKQQGKRLNIKLSQIFDSIEMSLSRRLTTVDSVRRHSRPIDFETLIEHAVLPSHAHSTTGIS